ncbi:BTAD domain-containing putative transcriptional regulator [Nocardia sp. NPDC059691]|uniref:AfsR/SARP family transcriptional regulator n=1 Tax=Nocardia sp. NPDC059691 TaxID=3346908 RepID=UPI0036BA7DC4
MKIVVDGCESAAAPRHRAVFAYLLVNVGRVCSAGRIIEAIWGTDPPDTARSQIHAAVTAIRKVLREANAAQVLQTTAAGYVALPGPGQLDLAEFTSRIGAGRLLAASEPEAAVAELRAALALWHGEALADLNAVYVASVRRRLQEKQLAAFEQLTEVELGLGRHEAVLDELAAMVSANPLREKLAGQLILALHRAGRQVDALAAARSFRTALAHAQGLDPGRAFVALEQAVLRDDVEPATHVTPPAARTEPVPRSANFLPYDIPDFAGRDAELGHLLAPLTGTAGTIATIDGMAGIGKTALAVHTAHRVADRFPDGQLFIDLQAHTIDRQPVATDTALEILLRQIGIPAERIPQTTADRGALWRSELAGRRVVAVLDNAVDADQVRPLLPGGTDSLVLITSRRRLIDLDGARALSVDPLPARDAVDLFERIVGERATAEPLAVLDVLHLCGFLPLAVRIAAARLLHRPQWTVGYLAGRLRGERRRLAELSTAERGVVAAFNLSYRQLRADGQRMFRLLGLHPGRDIDPVAAAALAGTSVDDAEMLLEGLLDVHVIAQYEPGRYTFHDLLRQHARAMVSVDESDDARAVALSRLFDHYLHTARTAVDLLFPYSAGHRQPLPPSAARVTPLDDAEAAAEWLDAERENLVTTAAYASEHGTPAHARDTAETLRPYLDGNSRHSDAARLHQVALLASRELADSIGEARALTDLGWACWRQGDYELATTHSRAALRVARLSGDRYQEARALNTLGNVAWRKREYDQAGRYLRDALDLANRLGNRVGEAHVLGNLGMLLGADNNRYRDAREHLDRALALHREVGNKRGEALVLNYLGSLCRRNDLLDEARHNHSRARDLYRMLGSRGDEASALNGLGETDRTAGDPGTATEQHGTALTLADEVLNLPERARANDGLARAYRDLGDVGRAREYAGTAMSLYANLGVPEADDMRVFLDTLPDSD